ncbi:MAG TPA: response regulator transcription factor, partial [Gemmatimonadales bacterium]|nr:response regulator transcription factor [Gemmatimonadales bacterium]
GRRYLSPPLSGAMIEAYLHQTSGAALDPYDTLTDREREVFHLSARGASHKEIARRLGISPRTAETHRGHAMHKLGLTNRTDLIRFALARGIIPSEPGSQSA